MATQQKVKTENLVFEDLIADFIIENRREPDFDEMRWMVSRIRRWGAYLAA